MKKIVKITFNILFLFVIVFYLSLVFLLPQIINNKFTIDKLQSFIYNRTGIETKITDLNFKVSPALGVVLNVGSVDAKNNNIALIDVKNLSLKYELLQKHLTLIKANNIYIDGNGLKQFKKEGKKKNKKIKLELNNLPEIHIKNVVFKSDEVNIYVENMDKDDDFIALRATIGSAFLKETLELGYSGSMQVVGNKIKAHKFEIKTGNSKLYIDGDLIDKDLVFDFAITGEKLPLSEIMPIVLQLQKLQDPSRRFIENFKNFNGTVNVDLRFNNNGLFGKCIGNNLSANAVWFDIPLYFKEAVFNFRGQQVDSVAEGILGREKVIHTLNITDLLTPHRHVIGTMKTTLTKKFDYIPDLTVLNSVNASIVYKIQYRKPDAYYNIDIPINSDLIYRSFYLGLRDYKRQIYGNTFKDNNDLYIKKYKYSYLVSGKENIILFGDGLFIKNIDKKDPDKFVPQYLTVRTNGYAPTSVIGSFGEKVRGGEFKGDLKYDFNKNQVLGTFDIINARHQAFRIENAHVISKNGIFNVTSNGLFKGEKYSAELNLKNNIYGETLVYDMKLFLDKLIFKTTPRKHKHKRKINSEEFARRVKNIDITINNLEISVNEIIRDRFVLQNAKLVGSLKRNIFDFNMQDLSVAGGTVHAKGLYNFNNNASKITFEAKNIDSNKAANMTLNLQNQVEGIANVKVNLDAKDMFRFLDAYCVFEIKEGFLPKLGDREFMIKNSKYKLSQITNFDLTQKELMKDDIRGSFNVHNTKIKNIKMTTWHELSAVFLEGNYDMEKQYADLQLFWHYSKKAPKGIRIFGIPVSLILKLVFRPEHSKELYQCKLSQIPKINEDEKNSRYYRIQLKGNINGNNIKLVLKEIR